MDPVTIEKLQAMKRYKRRSLLHRIISFLMSLIFLGLFLSCPLWLPKLYSSLLYFFLVCVPNARDVLLGPKCLFFVCNFIVVLLLRESKARGGAPDIYEEYAKRNKSMARSSLEKDQKTKKEEEEEGEEKIKGDGDGDACEGDPSDEEDDESGMPAEELNKMVEDFIAKVNNQRRLEERMLLPWE